jgi:hypothetical protein
MRSWLLVFLTIVATACMNKPSPAEPNKTTATLTGKVTISPVYPHERVGVSNEAPEDVYKAHKVVVYKEDAKTVVKEQQLDGKGNYKVELDPGTYMIDVLPHDIGIRPNARKPEKITIGSGEAAKHDIDLDTGIR